MRFLQRGLEHETINPRIKIGEWGGEEIGEWGGEEGKKKWKGDLVE